MERIALAVLVFSCSAVLLPAQTVQPFRVEWQKTFGGTNTDYPLRIAVARDGGYLVVAQSQSGISGNKETTNYGNNDCWLLRLDSKGNKVWERNIGGSSGEDPWDMKATSDGGWIIAGATGSGPSGNKTSPNYGSSDYWVVRLDDRGNVLWERTFGGSNYDAADAVIETPDGGFLVAGGSYSQTNEIKTLTPIGSSDIWLLKLDSQGNLLWQKLYGGIYQDWAYAIDRYGTNGFVIAGPSESPVSGNKSTPNYGAFDFWILAIDHEGNKLWDRTYGGDDRDELLNFRQTADGGFVACGWSSSGVSGNKTTPSAWGYDDFWIVRLDGSGDKVWERTLGQQQSDVPYALAQTIDGGFVVSGVSFWTNAWTVRLKADGNLAWQHSFNVNSVATSIRDVQCTPDGGLIAAGGLRSNDVLVMKWAPDALTAPQLELTRAANESLILLHGIAGRSYVVETSSDFQAWSPFATNTLSTNTIEVIDPGTTPLGRFYRAMMLPQAF